MAVIDSSAGPASTYFVHTGPLGEPLQMTDATEASVWDAYVEPYGQAQVLSSSVGLALRLPGQWEETEASDLAQNWHRNYDPTLGRYVQADPLGIEAGQNVYAYVDGDPLNGSDPRGLTKVILFSPTMGDLYQGAIADRDNPDECIVYAHGNNHDITDQRQGKDNLTSWQNADAKAFSKFLRSQGCKSNQIVVLKSCDTGAPGDRGHSPFAQYLANARRTRVRAPNRSIWFSAAGPLPTPYGHMGNDVNNSMKPNDPGCYIVFSPK